MNASPCDGRSNLASSLSHQERTISFGKETPPENVGCRNPTARAQAKDLSGVTFATCAKRGVTLRGTRNRLIIILSAEADVKSRILQANGLGKPSKTSPLYGSSGCNSGQNVRKKLDRGRSSFRALGGGPLRQGGLALTVRTIVSGLHLMREYSTVPERFARNVASGEKTRD